MPLFVEPVSVDRSSIPPLPGLRVGVASRRKEGGIDVARPCDRLRSPNASTTSRKVFLRTNVYPLLDGELSGESGEVAVHSDIILDMGLSAITDILCAELEMANVSQANKLKRSPGAARRFCGKVAELAELTELGKLITF